MLEGNFIQLSFWFQANGLGINSYKSEIVKFQTAQNRDSFDSSMSFDNNINTLSTSKCQGELLDKIVF